MVYFVKKMLPPISRSKWTWIFLTITLSACGPSSEEKDAINLTTGVVKISINEHRFDVPLRYMYGEAIEFYGRWPTPKKDVSKVDALSLNVLLPDMRPYYKEDDALWKVRGPGDRVNVTITKGVPRGLPSRKAIFDLAEKKRIYKKENDVYELTYFSGNMSNFYFSENADGSSVWINCSPPKPPEKWNGSYSPVCLIDSPYRQGIVLRYSYALQYLPQWKLIDEKLKSMFNQFSLSTQKAMT